MGIDFIDLCIRIEKEFGFSGHALDRERLDVQRDRGGTMVGATAGDIAAWVADCFVLQGKDVPGDLWVRVRGCIAGTVLAREESVVEGSRLIEDLGFS